MPQNLGHSSWVFLSQTLCVNTFEWKVFADIQIKDKMLEPRLLLSIILWIPFCLWPDNLCDVALVQTHTHLQRL